MSGKTNWFPLESNPDVMNKYLASLGVDTNAVSFHDVFGLDGDLLSMLPQPVLAMLLVYPVSDATEAEAVEQFKQQQETGALEALTAADSDKETSILFMKQTIRNACGTVGILHALLNANPSLTRPAFAPGSFIDRFSRAAVALTPLERAKLMEDSQELHSAQETAAADGVTPNASIEEDVDLHFVCFTMGPNGTVLEFDGRQEGPILRGLVDPSCVDAEDSTVSPSLEIACAKAIRKRMALDPNNLRFTITALCAAPSAE